MSSSIPASPPPPQKPPPTGPYEQGPIRNPDPPMPPGRPVPPPGTIGLVGACVVFALVLLVASGAWAAGAGVGGGDLPYSQWLTKFRTSVGGEVAMTLSLVCIVAGVIGWVAGGELTGMLLYIVRAVCGLAIVMGAVAFLGTIGVGGATLESRFWVYVAGTILSVIVYLIGGRYQGRTRNALRAGAVTGGFLSVISLALIW